MLSDTAQRKTAVLQLNNRGSALVVVIIAMAFIGILASGLMYTAGMNYQMKVNNQLAKDNFYSAESVLDEIRMGMQADVSVAVKEAYASVLTTFDTSSAETKQYQMRYRFLSKMQEHYKVGSEVGSFDLCDVYDYVQSTAEGTVLETKDSAGVVHRISRNAAGKYVDDAGNEVPAGAAKGVMVLYDDGLALKDVKVIYTDANQYVSVIETDLRIQLPDMEFAQAVSLPSLTAFSVVAQKDLIAAPDNIALASINTIRGSFFADRLIVGSENSHSAVDLRLEENAVGYNSDKRMVVAKDIYLGQGAKLSSDQYGELWASSVSMHGGYSGVNANIDFNGADIYVAGDLEIEGDGNSFAVGELQADGNYKGKYVGFGSGEYTSDSSSIIINGVNTEIKFDELTELTLAGNAYIGLSNDDAGLEPTDPVANGVVPDLVMGQSIAVKSDQIAYLVPPQCIGIDKETGRNVISHPSNPMTLAEYQNYIQGRSNVQEVSADIACDALDGKKLSDYGIVTEGGNPMFRRYFKRINSEITLVYYFVTFDNTSKTSLEQANRYFKDYYKVNKSTMDAYASLYTDGIQMRDTADGFYTLHLAGNIVCEKSGSAQLQDATLSYDETNLGYQNELEADYFKFKALSKKMIDVYDLLTPSETADTANAYSNLVRPENVAAYQAAVLSDGAIVDKSGARYFGDAGEKALIVHGDYTYTGAGDDNFKGLIIATGNVTVNHNFQGTILCGGNLTLGQNVTVEPAEEAVLHALTYSRTVGGKEYHVTDFLTGGSGYLKDGSKTYVNSDINIGELVVYENWEKQ